MTNTPMQPMPDSMLYLPGTGRLDVAVVQNCMEACSANEQACTMCAAHGLDCTAACMNCADMSSTMMRTLMRMSSMTPAVMIAMLDACLAMCQLCLDECAPHADADDVCRMCAQSTQVCMDACGALKAVIVGSK